jgi:hypothetical protein
MGWNIVYDYDYVYGKAGKNEFMTIGLEPMESLKVQSG